jgi:hypothetical protein
MRLDGPKGPDHLHVKVHWHVTVTYLGFEDGHEERIFGDLHLALDWANDLRRALTDSTHHSWTELADGHDLRKGVIRRYYVSDEYGAPLAIIELRSCLDESHGSSRGW